MYSLEKPIGDMKFIVDTRYLAAMNTPGGGKNDIPHRLKRQFAIFNVPLPSVAAINGIFGKLVEGRFSADVVTDEVVFVASKLVPLTITLWNKTQAKMLPTPAKFHYLVRPTALYLNLVIMPTCHTPPTRYPPQPSPYV